MVRKIDLHLILPLFGLFIFNILDRSNIASARLGGMQEDLKLSDTQYQTSVSILVSRLLFACRPLNNKVSVRWVPFGTSPEQHYPHSRQAISIPSDGDACLGWYLTCHCRHTQFRWYPDGSILPRFRGVSVLRRCTVSYLTSFRQHTSDLYRLLISSWYKPSEIAPRVAVMYCGNTVANGFGGVLAAGVLSGLDNAAGFAGWR